MRRQIVDNKICCTKCKEWKTLDNFHKDKQTSTGYRHECFDCKAKRQIVYNLKPSVQLNSRERNLKAKYGLSIDEYNSILEKQNGRCAICKCLPTVEMVNRKGSRPIVFDTLVVDHDHISGKVRGLLCRKCNIALGHFQDNVETLANAITYLSNK